MKNLLNRVRNHHIALHVYNLRMSKPEYSVDSQSRVISYVTTA